MKVEDKYTEHDKYRYSEPDHKAYSTYYGYTNIQLRFFELACNYGLYNFNTNSYFSSISFEVLNYYRYTKQFVDEELKMRGLPPFQLLPLKEQIRINNLLLEYAETDYSEEYHNNPYGIGTKIIVRIKENYNVLARLTFIKNKAKDSKH